jgi:hypothetical protein
MRLELLRHRLSMVVRFEDYFSGEAINEELPVRLQGSFQRPVPRRGSASRRQPDGTYRFINAPGGATRILWRRPFTTSHSGWTRFEDTDPSVALPLAQPSEPLRVSLWPTADAKAPAGATGVRGKLTGPDFARQKIAIALSGQPFGPETRSDETGNFLFLLAGRLTLDSNGRVPLVIRVRTAADAPRLMSGGTFVPDTAGAPFVADTFAIAPSGVPRILFRLA